MAQVALHVARDSKPGPANFFETSQELVQRLSELTKGGVSECLQLKLFSYLTEQGL